ncbi:MAG: hydroxylamine reductase [Methanospirillum sp.]|nr:hydroxylamine reductase [Methanospirillum sp.]
MFCYQCEETVRGTGCTTRGVCGKDEVLAGLQDVLLYVARGIAHRDLAAREAGGAGSDEARHILIDALFMTITNVNFDPEVFRDEIRRAVALRDALPPAGPGAPDAATWTPASDADVDAKVAEAGVLATGDEDVRSLRWMLIYGLKGMAAYYHHAAVLGFADDAIEEFIERGLASTLRDLPVDEMIALDLECGRMGVATMALLDRANTSTYGDPVITPVKTTAGNRPGIVVTGHDLKDLYQLLEQSKDAGIDIYTHGEMLPAHAYPKLKAFPHLVGQYGTAWQKQREEFELFNGPILFTTNCIIPPKESYVGRIYTTGPVGWPGTTHIDAGPDGTKDFSALIRHAKASPPPEPLPGTGRDLITGCAHKAVLELAGTIVEAVKNGDITRFVVMAGCDGRHREREYYTEFAKALPQSTVILTAGCAKYRYNALDLGDIGGIPRVVDAGQCNDCYSLVVIAQALADAFGVGVNDLPLSFNIAWYEQKAVLVLLALLSLGIRNITLGPKLPAFVSPNVLKVLVENFNITPNTTVEEDMARLVPA